MVPPGNSLEFYESEQFKRASAGSRELRESVIEHLKAWPQSGKEVAKGVREMPFKWRGLDLIVLFRRQGQKIGLMHLMELPRQQALLDELRARAIELFGPVMPGGKR